MRYQAVEHLRDQYPVGRLCRTLGASPSGYYRWQRREETDRVREDRHLKQKILTIHGEVKGRYGTPRIERELRRRGVGTSRRRVARLRRELGLRAKAARKFKATTDSAHPYPVAPNRLERRFQSSAANRIWVGDITYLWTREGWLYLAVVEDTFSRRIVGWSVSDRLERDLAVTALQNALAGRSPCPGLIHHTDRGSQYASSDYRELVENAGLVFSMSRKGDCSSLGYITPADMLAGKETEIWKGREDKLEAAREARRLRRQRLHTDQSVREPTSESSSR